MCVCDSKKAGFVTGTRARWVLDLAELVERCPEESL